MPAPEGPETTMGRVLRSGEGGGRVSGCGMGVSEGGVYVYVPVGAIVVASWRRQVGKGVKFLVRRRVEFERVEVAERLLKTFVKQ